MKQAISLGWRLLACRPKQFLRGVKQVHCFFVRSGLYPCHGLIGLYYELHGVCCRSGSCFSENLPMNGPIVSRVSIVTSSSTEPCKTLCLRNMLMAVVAVLRRCWSHMWGLPGFDGSPRKTWPLHSQGTFALLRPQPLHPCHAAFLYVLCLGVVGQVRVSATITEQANAESCAAHDLEVL